MFDTAQDYRLHNGGAHRKPASRIKAPTLTCHMGFYSPEFGSGASHPVDRQPNLGMKNKWKDDIDEFLGRMIRQIIKRTGMSNDLHINTLVSGDNKILLFNNILNIDSMAMKTAFSRNDYESIIVDSSLNLTERQVDIMLSDYRVVQIEFKFEKIFRIEMRVELHTEYFTITFFVQVDSQAIDEGSLQGDSLVGSLSLSISSISRCIRSRSLDEVRLKQAGNYLFDEFWSSILERCLSMRSVLEEMRKKSHDLGKVFLDARGTILSDETVDFNQEIDFCTKDLSWGDALAQTFLPVVSDFHRHECTASYMLDGRALYVTALGPQPPEAPDHERIPVKYILYVHQRNPVDRSKSVVNRWQLGRLVNRIHSMGTARLAALTDLHGLRMAGIVLADLEPIVRKARESTSDDDASDRDVNQLIREVNNHLAKIKISGGLQYRAERSRYYATQIRAQAKSLRIGRVSGFQPYDLFVESRLGSSFDYIDRLGKRYERAIESISVLYQSLVARRTSKILIRSEATNDEIRAIQGFGELLLICFLIPYYSTNNLEHTGTDVPWLFGDLIWALCVGGYAFRFFFSRSGPNNFLRACIGSFAVFVGAFLLLLGFGLVAWGATSDRVVHYFNIPHAAKTD